MHGGQPEVHPARGHRPHEPGLPAGQLQAARRAFDDDHACLWVEGEDRVAKRFRSCLQSSVCGCDQDCYNPTTLLKTLSPVLLATPLRLAAQNANVNRKTAEEVHQSAIVIDTHADTTQRLVDEN